MKKTRILWADLAKARAIVSICLVKIKPTFNICRMALHTTPRGILLHCYPKITTITPTIMKCQEPIIFQRSGKTRLGAIRILLDLLLSSSHHLRLQTERKPIKRIKSHLMWIWYQAQVIQANIRITIHNQEVVNLTRDLLQQLRIHQEMIIDTLSESNLSQRIIILTGKPIL